MSDALLLDTHIALWLDSGDEQLKPATRAVIDRCWRGGGTIFLSAASAWEIAVLVDRGHIQLDLPLDRKAGGAGFANRLATFARGQIVQPHARDGRGSAPRLGRGNPPTCPRCSHRAWGRRGS
ncbi:MAG: hypothetical protein HQL41_12345 [Alphaproteobacteria bacterium]|nr:hypothetical protein [Alphaproteobacteria bacterium]